MSRKKAIIVGVVILILAVGLELAFRSGDAGTGCVQVVNEGNEPMEGLFASHAGTSVNLGRLAPGEKSKVWFSATGRRGLKLEFTQKGNPMKGFQVDDFDPAEHRRDGSRLVLVVKNNQVERYVEQDESIKSPPRMLERLVDWIKAEIHE
jgi:hypothetical protein